MIRVQLKFGDGDMPPQKKIKITVGGREVSSPVNNAEKESTTAASDASEDWRVGHWHQRLHYARTNDLLCDVTFEVEGKEFKAHKLLLAMASPAFEAMFYGGMAEKGDRVVITDLTADGFEALLEYIYTNGTSLTTMEEGFQLWVAADKYCIPHVKSECAAHFGRCPLTTENIWTTLQTALFLDIDPVARRCFEYLMVNAEEVMLMEDFEKISVGAMESFLSLDILNTSELMLMQGLVKWGKARMNTQPEMTLKQAVEPCIQLIRFSAMTIEDFCKVLDESHKAFDDADALAILKHLAKPRYPLPAWCCKFSWDRTRSYKGKVVPYTPLHAAGPSRPTKDSPPPEEPVLRRKISRYSASSSSSSSSDSDSSSSSTSPWEESESSLEERTRPDPGPRRRRRDVEVFHRVLG